MHLHQFPLNCFYVYLLMYLIFRAGFLSENKSRFLKGNGLSSHEKCHLKEPLSIEMLGNAPETFLMCDSAKSHTCTVLGMNSLCSK